MVSRGDIHAHRQYIDSALEHAGGTHLFEDVEALILDGRAQLWPTPHGAIVTQVAEYPRIKVCNIWLLAGKRSELFEMMKYIELWARGIGCARLEANARMGWLRHPDPKALEWSVRNVNWEKAL
jgi:hypothetical protein